MNIAEIQEKLLDVMRLSDEERKLLDEALDEANRGIFVSDEDMDTFWNRHQAQVDH